ncbi:hypothetical protein WA588_002438 [Blastocystis sp. NMH]
MNPENCLQNYHIDLLEGRDFTFKEDAVPSSIYCLFRIGDSVVKSNPIDSNIQKPEWYQVFDITSPQNDICVELHGLCKDEDVLLGNTSILFEDLSLKGSDNWCSIMGVTGEENVCVGQLLITITSSPASGSSDFAPSPPLSVDSTTLDAAAAEECDPLPPTVSVPVPPEAPEAPVPVISAPMTPAPMTPSPFLSPSFDSHTSLFSSMPPASPSESTSRPPSMPAPAAPVAPDCETPPPAMSAPLRPAFPALPTFASPNLEDDSLSDESEEETEPLPPSIPAPVAPSESAKPPLPSAPKPSLILTEESSESTETRQNPPEPPKMSELPSVFPRFPPELPKLPTRAERKPLPPLPPKEMSGNKPLPPVKPPKPAAKPAVKPSVATETPKRFEALPPLPPKVAKPLPKLPPRRKPLPKLPERIPDAIKTETEPSPTEN